MRFFRNFLVMAVLIVATENNRISADLAICLSFVLGTVLADF